VKEYRDALEAERAPRREAELKRLQEAGFNLGDRVVYYAPVLGGLAGGTKHVGIIKQDADGNIYVHEITGSRQNLAFWWGGRRKMNLWVQKKRMPQNHLKDGRLRLKSHKELNSITFLKYSNGYSQGWNGNRNWDSISQD